MALRALRETKRDAEDQKNEFKRRKLIKDHEAKEIRRHAEIIDRKLRGLINSLRGRL